MFAAAIALLHPGESFSWTEWTLYPDFLIGWLLMFGGYMLIIGPGRRFFPGSSRISSWRIASFVLGMMIMLVALQGPLHELSDYFLFSAHMVQHLLVMVVMPPFLLAGTPGWALRPVIRIRPIGKLAAWLTLPLVAFALNNVIFGAWHFPGPYDLMMRNHDVHVLMHLMIMATGVAMWWPVMSPLPELPRLAPPLQMLYLFILGIPMMVVAALITLTGDPLYQWYVEAPRIFALSPHEDQRLGGIIMWVPGALTLWIGITFVYFRWTHREGDREEQSGKVGQSGIVISPPPFPENTLR
ncbi:cytochrome c oxidase assembly factor CtaG [soil metagenome]